MTLETFLSSTSGQGFQNTSDSPTWQAFARAGAGEEGGKETPARRPLFSPSRLLVMCANWLSNCLAAIHLFLAFVFLKQEI